MGFRVWGGEVQVHSQSMDCRGAAGGRGRGRRGRFFLERRGGREGGGLRFLFCFC